MRNGLDISPAGPWGEPGQQAEFAALAERSGWDGVFCEDYLAFRDGLRAYDPWITLGLMAGATTRITLGTMVTPLPWRQPSSVAAQAMTIDQISGGRFVLGVGSGDTGGPDARFVESMSLKQRVERLDEGLEVIAALWSGEPVTHHGRHFHLDEALLLPRPVQRPRIPIWVGGQLTRPGPRARALRWDGACLYAAPPEDDWVDLTVEDVRRLRADGGPGFVIAVGGRRRRADLAAERDYAAALAEAGVDWLHEYVPPDVSPAQARERIESGPISAD
ncbi:MAG TPA: LLM class flavin-dependent oxidoreductase [Pseudonocardiaceae bacterium]|nr:LLM class flavin-dependent oxidoreductase [Pseudonocardiaceae bacterium]